MIYIFLSVVLIGLVICSVLIFIRKKPEPHKVNNLGSINRQPDELPDGIKFRKTYYIYTEYSSFSNRNESGSVRVNSSKDHKGTTYVSYPGPNALNQDREKVPLSASNEEHSNSNHEGSCKDGDSSGSDI